MLATFTRWLFIFYLGSIFLAFSLDPTSTLQNIWTSSTRPCSNTPTWRQLSRQAALCRLEENAQRIRRWSRVYSFSACLSCLDRHTVLLFHWNPSLSRKVFFIGNHHSWSCRRAILLILLQHLVIPVCRTFWALKVLCHLESDWGASSRYLEYYIQIFLV